MHEQFQTIESTLLNIPGVINYSKEFLFEAKPGLLIPVFINIKNTLPDVIARQFIVSKLAHAVGDGIDSICGMESGGNYYASAVADILEKPVCYFRKEAKLYGDKTRIVGQTPNSSMRIAIIDDVIASGVTVAEAVRYFTTLGCSASVFVLFGYRSDQEFAQTLQINIKSLTNFQNLFPVAQQTGFWNEEDIVFLKTFLVSHTNIE